MGNNAETIARMMVKGNDKLPGDQIIQLMVSLDDEGQVEYARQYMLDHLRDYLEGHGIDLEVLKRRKTGSLEAIETAKKELEEAKSEEELKDARGALNQKIGYNLALTELIEEYTQE